MKRVCPVWPSVFVLLMLVGCGGQNQTQQGGPGDLAAEEESFDADATAKTLAEIEVDNAIETLQDATRIGSWGERAQAIKKFRQHGENARLAVPVLRTVLGNPREHWLVQAGAACVLAELSPAALVGMKNQPPQVRLTAAYALGETSSRAEEVRIALESALDDEDWEVRSEAARSLVFRGVEAVPSLQKSLHDRDPRVRAAAAWSLGRLGRPAQSAAEALRVALSDDDWLVRSTAVYALGRMGAETNADIAAAANDAEWGVRSAAQVLRSGISGSDRAPLTTDATASPQPDDGESLPAATPPRSSAPAGR